MAISSYGASTDSSGVVRILKDLDINIEGRHVLVVEDIIDSRPDALATSSATSSRASPRASRSARC